MFPKPKRTENRDLLDSYCGKPCVCCGNPLSTVAHHIKSKGSGGPDEEWNLLPLCYVHHTEIHKRGPSYMIQQYFALGRYLRKLGWQIDEHNNLKRIKPQPIR
jgi:hypothetical protein